MSAPAELVSLAKQNALAHHLDPAIVCAIIEQESSWNPHAIRYEPLFFAKYVAPLYTNNKISATEAYARGFSWGLMQVMGQTAREAGFAEPFLSLLCDPGTALEVGCRVFRKKLDTANNQSLFRSEQPQVPAPSEGISPTPSEATGNGVVTRALLLWNGGANPNYASEVLARRPHYL
jgi:hypothetical protein